MVEFTEKIPQHKHCHLCGKAYIDEGNFCSKECKDSEGVEVKKKLRKYGVIIVIIWVVTIAAIFFIGF